MVASKTRPRIIIHGGAGNITRQNLAPEAYHSYRNALLSILEDSHSLLSQPDATALNVATHAVSLLEDNPLFNSGHGAVFTTAGTHELEASVMTSTGHCKRGVGIMLVDRVKNPIKFAREMLLRGEEADGGGAGGHCQLSGDTVHKLAEDWGLDMVSPSYYWTKKRWDEHRKGLGLSTDDETYRKKKHEVEGRSELGFEVADGEYVGVGLSDPSWDGLEYLPQGTVGCVVLDSEGTLCVATSTGGLTNKLPGRIGDTPTIGAGFFAEEWLEESPAKRQAMLYRQPEFVSSSAPRSTNNFCGLLRDCLPSLWSSYTPLLDTETEDTPVMLSEKLSRRRRGIAISGTGNGDSFLRLSAVRTACAIPRFSTSPIPISLSTALSQVAGPHGMLEESAAERFGKTGEGEGGMIGIEYRNGKGEIAAGFNCGGLFRAWVDDGGVSRMRVFRDEYI